jgi:flagellar motor switch protein FliG
MKKKIKGFESAIEALRGLDAASQERILAEIVKKDPAMAERLKKNMVLFDDLLRINPQGLMRLFQEIPDPQWVLALRGKKEDFIQALLKPLAKRRAEIITEAMKHLGPQPMSKVETAQKHIIEKVLQLEAQGLLIFSTGDDPMV